MFCPSCGTENKEGSKFCWKCGGQLAQNSPVSGTSPQGEGLLNHAVTPPVLRQPSQAASSTTSAYKNFPAPDNFLVQAILATLCCCLPFGIASIVYASQVNSKAVAGDMAGAHESARKARFWFWWALGVGIPVQILAVFLNIVASTIK